MASKGVEAAQELAWEALAKLDPQTVCERAAVTYAAAASVYQVTSLGQDLLVDLPSRTLACASPAGNQMLGPLGLFSRIAVLHYLVHAQCLPAAGRLVSPGDLAAAPLYARGTHVLPTEPLATAYADSPERVSARGKALGGQPLAYGDLALRLLPLPRVPVVVVFWRGDDEFPPRASLLLDATCEAHLAADIVWSTAMLTALMLLP